MKKFLCFFLASCLALTMACNKDKEPENVGDDVEISANPSYEGVGIGYGGEIKVEVVTKEDKIVNVKLVDSKESSPIIKRAFPIIRERILEAQSPVVDSVSGATFTSFGVKQAVNEACKEFGQDFGEITFATKGEEKERRDLESVNTQLLIVGGGPAGLSAAIEAKSSGIENVILIEKLDILSGNGKFDMNFFDLINSQAQKNNGIEITPDSFIKSKQESLDSPERLNAWAQGSYELDEWLRSYGINLNYSYGGTNHMAEDNLYAGEYIQDIMEMKVKELDVDIRTGTKGYDLIFEGNKVVGVKVENNNDYYDIYADAVILATGGFAANKGLLSQYIPGSEEVATSNQIGATGDFISVFENYGLQTNNMEVLTVFKMILKNTRDLTGAGDGFILVNKDGNRFVDESSSGLPLAYKILEQPDKKVFYIYDQRLYDSSYRLQKHNDLEYHVKADTLEELAEKLGIDKENLVASINSYNKGVTNEEKDPFREISFTEQFASSGPYYGAQIESAIHMTKGGVVANEKSQVLNNEGYAVEGLYAAGEVVSTSAAYSGSVVFGRIAAKEAAKEILNNN